MQVSYTRRVRMLALFQDRISMLSAKTYSRKFYISTNSTCNLRCIYCFEKDKKQFEFNIEEAIEVISEQLSTVTSNGTQISLRGGEPFVVFPKIRQLCETLWRKKFEEYYHIHITTNGTLIHGEIKEWLARNSDKITLKLSLDGNRRTSEINRPSSFDKIDFAFLLSTWPEMKVNMTITSYTLPYLAENVRFIHSLGVKHILSHFSIMTPWDTCKLETVLYKQLLILVDFYIQNPNLEPCNLLNSDISLTLRDNPIFTPCNKGQLTYDSQTKAYYPCYMCFPSVGGEQVAKEFQHIDFKDANNLLDECCKKCPFVNICVTCLAENYISRGAMSHRDMALCKYHKVSFAALFQFEYKRLLHLQSPSALDILKMKAINKWHNVIEDIIDNIE